MSTLFPLLAAAAPSGDLGGWLHTIDPFLVRFSGGFGIRWYGLSYLAGFIAAFLILYRLAARGLIRIPKDRVSDAVLVAVVGVVVGGRLGYILLYQPSLLWTVRPQFPWWDAIALNRGGMASHGGMVGVLLAAWVVSRGFRTDQGRREGRTSPLHVLDAFTLVAPLGLMFGRIANFINGELLGRVVAQPGEHAPWWAVRFPQEINERYLPFVLDGQAPPDIHHTPAQAAALERLLLEQQIIENERWESLASRLVERVQEGAPDLAARIEPLLTARHPSQLYQAAAEGIVVGLVVWAVFALPRRPGVVSAWFAISYGVMRILTEFVRLPDVGVPRVLGLSRGQWLSVALIIAGLGLLFLAARRRSEPKLGGWLRPAETTAAS